MAYRLTPYDRRVQAELIRKEREARYASRYPTYKKTGAATVAPVQDEKKNDNAFLRVLQTGLDLSNNFAGGVWQSVEGLVDLVATGVGAIGGIFSDDFQDGVKDFVATDYTDKLFMQNMDKLTEGSYLNEGKAGEIIEGVAQGVGQMLPDVLISVATMGAYSGVAGAKAAATAGTVAAKQAAKAAAKTAAKQAAIKAGQRAAMVSLAAHATGSGIQEAFADGASYGEGVAYGALTGATEVATEKLTGGMGRLYGKGIGAAVKTGAKTVGKEVAEVGAKRVLKEMAGEGMEEVISEATNPLRKTIYKGKDALKEYSDEEFWGGVAEAGAVGALTSAAYGGTVGKVMKTSGVYADARNVVEHIEQQQKKAQDLKKRGKLTGEQAAQLESNIKSDYELLSKRLQKASDKTRARVLENPQFARAFESDGALKADFAASLERNIAAAGDSTYRLGYRSTNLDADTITKVLEKNSKDGQTVTAFDGELDEAGKKGLSVFQESMDAIGELNGGKTRYVVVQGLDGNASFDPDSGVIAINADQFSNGEGALVAVKSAVQSELWQGALVHETAHSTEGTTSHAVLADHLMSDNVVYGQAVSDFIERGYFGVDADAASDKLNALLKKSKNGDTLTEQEKSDLDTAVTEIVAIATENVLGNAAFIKRLVKGEPSVAEKILNKIVQIRDAVAGKRTAEQKKAEAFLNRAEQLYLNAIKESGFAYRDGKIVTADDEDEDEAQKEKSPAKGRVQSIQFSRMNNLSLSENVDLVMEMSDADALKNKEEGNYISVMKTTPTIVADSVADAENLEIVMRFDAFYLATRQSGVLEGHYHNYGDVMKKLPDILRDPLAIVRMDNGRLNFFAMVPHPKGNNNVISLELNAVKDINSQYKKYNLIITVTPAKENYVRNTLVKHGVEVEYKKEDLPQVNNQLYEWLAIINDKSSNNSITETEPIVNRKIQESRKVQYSMAGKKARTADKMKLATAQQMIAEGVDSETVRRETGWFQGYDGEWRFEIDDSQMEFSREGYGINELEKLMKEERKLAAEIAYNKFENPDKDISELNERHKALVEKMKNTPAVTLPFYVKHDALFEAYPELRQVKVVLKPRDFSGGYSIKDNEIRIDSRFSDDEIKEALLHEMQHAVQQIEDFSGGANTTYWADRMGEADPEAYDRAVDRLNSAYKRLVERSSDVFLAKVKAFWRLAPKNKTQKYSPQAKALFDELMEHDEGDRFYDYVYALQTKQELDDRFGKNNPYDMYLRTAGEVEANDTMRRMKLTAEQRKDIRPDIDRTNVLFADKESVFFGKKTTDFDKIILPDDVKYLGNRVDDYMAFRGWAEGILSAEDRQLLRERIADIKIRGYQGHIQLADGALLLDVNNKIVLVSGDFNDPVYDAVIDISADTETEASYFKEVFLGEFQRQQYSLRECNEFVEALLGEKYVKIYNRTNYFSSDGSQIQSLPTREKTRRDYGYSENQQYGRRGSRKITERHFNDDGSVTLTYSDKSTEIEPSKPQKGKVKMSRRAGEMVMLSKGQIAALRANYEGDKVFTKKEVAAAISTIDALQKLPAKERSELVTHLWRGYNERLNEQGFEQFSEIMWHRIHAEILQESGFEMGEDEIAHMDEQIVNALEQIVKSGKPSVRARLESATSTEGYRKQADFWRGEHSKAVQRNKQLNSLKFELEKLANQKKGLYVNAANYHSDDFKVAIDELAKMNWRGGLVSDTKIREHFAKLAAFYTKKNPLYAGDGNGNELFRQEIADALADLGNSQNGALSVEDLQAAETVVKYFAHEIEAHNTVFKDGKRVDAMPEAKDYIEKARRAKEIAAKCGIWSNLMRSKFARMVADPAMLMRQADGYLSGFFTEQYEALRQGTIDAAVLERELSEEFEKFWEEHKAYAKRYNDATVKFGDTEMPLQEAISLFMTMKREHAFAGLAGAGFEIDGKKATENISDGFADEVNRQLAEDWKALPPEELLTLTKKKNAEMERAALKTVIEKKRQALYDQFTAEDRELIALMERAFEQCRDVKVKIDEIVQGYSNVTGGYYYPIKRTGLAENVDAYTGFEGDRVTNLSMNKETVKNAHKLLIEPAHIVFMRHLKATSLYHGLGVFTDNFNRLYNLNIGSNANNPITVRTALGQSTKFTQEMVKYFKELKQDVEGISKKRSQEKAYNDAVAFIRSSYATYQLGANPKVWVTQLSSLIAATNIIDADCLAKGLSVSGKDVDEFCRLAWLRNNDSSAAQAQAVGTSQNAVQRASRNVLQKVRDVAMLPIGKVDRLVIIRLFGACQVQIEKKGGAKVGTKENKIEAGKLLQRVILETQQNSLATERSAMMRSSDELLKGNSMFMADAMKVGARFVDAFGELSVLRTLYREAKKAGNSKDMARLEGEIKRARKQCVRATVSLVGVALFNAALAYGFKWLYRRDEDESLGSFIADTFGNMLGGIPFVRDLWSFFQDGFEMDHFLISTVNDVLGTVSASFELVSDAASGKEVTRQQVLANMRKVVYAAGQLSGVPTRNLYNFTTGVINRVSPEAGYAVESNFYKQSYASDLQKALDAGDDKMVGTIAGLMIDEKIGIEDAATRKTLQDLTSKGYKVLPRSVGDSVTVDGETVELTGAQQKKLREVYAIGQDAVADMVKLKQFAEADEKVQAAAIKFIYDVYWDLALEDALGVDLAEKNVLFAEAIDIEKLAVIIAMARSIEADKDKNGKAISGTRKRKVQTFVNSLRLSAAEKYMVMGYLGYTNVNGESAVKAHISKLNLSKSEKAALLKYSGYGA